MKIFTRILLPFILLLSLSCKKREPSQAMLNAEYELSIDMLTDSIMQHTPIPGMVVGVWFDDIQFQYLKTRGYNNLATKRAMQVNDPFRIGSNTKTMVVTMLLQLVDEKKLNLNDRLSKFFPLLPDADKVTISMLCNMRSGIPSYTLNASFEEQMNKNPLRVWQPEELVELSFKAPYTFEPGTAFEYSNTNTVLIGLLIEKLTQKSLKENLENRIFKRLNMQHTFLAEGPLLPNDGVHGYDIDKSTKTYTVDVSEHYDLSWAWAAGGGISTATELKNYVRNLVHGNLSSAETHNLRFSSIANGNFIYGLGMFTFGDNMWGHNGGLPGYTSVMMQHRTKNFTIIIFYNLQYDTVKDVAGKKYYSPEELYNRIVQTFRPYLN